MLLIEGRLAGENIETRCRANRNKKGDEIFISSPLVKKSLCYLISIIFLVSLKSSASNL